MNSDAMKEREPARVSVLRVRSAPMLAFPEGRAFPESGTSFPERPFMTLHRQRGFSLIELLVTIGIGFTIAGITFIAMMPMFNRNHVDSAYFTTMMALRNTRQLAISQSHQYFVNFNPAGFPAGTIQITYQPPAVGGILPAVQQVATYTLPKDISFAVMGGFPANAPDAFGSGITAIDFGQGLGAGSLTYVCFMPDGSSQDSLGNYNSGVVYISRTADPTIYNARAISVWGATGRVRGWHLYKQGGGPIWVQQ
jgi:prepilin-type N-terminal cleavage/methylation domain-containing protein